MNRIGIRNLRYRKNKGTSCLIVLLFFVLIALLAVFWKLHADTIMSAMNKPAPALVDSTKAPLKPAQEAPKPPEQPDKPDAPAAAELAQARMINKGDYLLVQKAKHLLHHYRDGNLLASYTVALGKNPEDKAKEGDNATPEGHYEVNFIKDSKGWEHDFKDGKGSIKGAYGPFFIALYTGAKGSFSGKTWRGNGIHGTHDPSSIGTNASEGCIRLHNEELLKLKAEIEDKGHIPIDIIK